MKTASQLVLRLALATASLVGVAALSGCGVGVVNLSSSGRLAVNGNVHGGAQPVTGAQIELFATGTTGNGSQATSLLTNPVYTGASGSFSLTGDYTCSSPTEQVYLVAKGGNPGLPGNVNNTSLVMMSALGSCASLMNSTYVWVDEVSTVAAVYALAPFMAAYDHVGSSATNTVGITNAFLNAQLLANTSSGQATALPTNLSIEQQKLYALADVISNCANSNGGSPCTRLFAAATVNGGTAPTDTAGALLNIVKNPANNVAGIFNLITATPPYANTLTQAPNDWTMSLTVTGGGLFQPTAFALDALGNVWVANFGGPGTNGSNPLGVVAYSPQGTPFSGTPYSNGQMSEIFGLAIDKNNDVWVTSEENIRHDNTVGSIAKISGANSSNPGTYVGMFYDDSLDYPEAIATDPNTGTVLVANYGSSTASVYDLNGNYLNNLGAGAAAHPTGITSDGAGGLWLANEGASYLTHIAANGTTVQSKCCYGPYTVALDPWGNAWASNNVVFGGKYTFSEVGANGTVMLKNQTATGLYTPAGAAVDAAGTFWVLNYHAGTFVGVAGNNNPNFTAGTAMAPIAFGKDAGMVEPYKIAPDASGNLWVSNSAGSSMVMFFGLATPTATPATPLPVAP